jgi:membrane protein implicated in regulation of membrane protease activity
MDWAFLSSVGAAHWFALGLVLLIAELFSGTTYLLWPAVSAWLVGLVMLFLPLPMAAQLTVFGVATLATTLTGRNYVKGPLLGPGAATMNDRAAQLVGAKGQAATAFENGVGRVKLGDSEWRGASDDAIGAGDPVVVLSVDGATLNVKRT